MGRSLVSDSIAASKPHSGPSFFQQSLELERHYKGLDWRGGGNEAVAGATLGATFGAVLGVPGGPVGAAIGAGVGATLGLVGGIGTGAVLSQYDKIKSIIVI